MNGTVNEKACVETVRRPIGDIMRENTGYLLECGDLAKQIVNSLVDGVDEDCDCSKPNACCMREEAENQSAALREIVETLSYILRMLEG